MNVGSILNKDPPPTAVEEEEDCPKKQQSSFPSHSLVNLLNGPQVEETKKEDVKKDVKGEIKEEIKEEVEEETDKFVPENHDDEGEDEKTSDAPVETTPEVPEIKKDGDGPVKNDSKKDDEDELQKIDKLKLGNKPRRYNSPPIWAQEWIPQFQLDQKEFVGVADAQTGLSNRHVFDTTLTVSVDLECSVTGVIPPSSVTRTIAEWIYANFTEIPSHQRKFVELELKFGTIMDKKTGHRIDINVSTECIYTDTSGTYFDMGVHEVGWNDMCQFLDDLEKKYQDEMRKNPVAFANKPKRKFNLLETDTTDTFYQITTRNEQPKSIRVSKDNLLDPPRYTAINKQRVSHLFIHNPSSMYDLRLSLSFENPIPDSSVDAIIKKNQPNLTRMKKRNSWTHRQTATRFDMTRVFSPRELKSKSGKKIVEQDLSHEVELEIDTLELFAGFDKFKTGSDSIRFEELVEIFVNNARCLNNRVTKLANK